MMRLDGGIVSRLMYLLIRFDKWVPDAVEGYDLGPPPAATAESGLEGDMWGDPEIQISADADDDDEDEDILEAPCSEQPSSLPRPPHFDQEMNPFVMIVDVSGIHHLPVVSCLCDQADFHLDIAYVKMGLFPTSFDRIQTLFTIDVLKDFRLSNLECKTSAYQYYQKLRRLTCPAFPKTFLNRYRELHRLSREYRNLKLWKMHGHAHDDPDGPDISVHARATEISPGGMAAESRTMERH